MADSAAHRAMNRDLWEKRVRAHLQFELYPSKAVEEGTYTVNEPQPAELGDVAGKRLLHLQCNAGADTLYWARRGASVVGVDFSQTAIDEARRLAEVTGADAEFICSDIYELSPQRGFDIVYTSTGVLWWLPDLTRWGQVIAEHLKPGGVFYIYEIHPFSMIYDWGADLTPTVDYFSATAPRIYENSDGTYYEAGDDFASEAGTECGWTHTLADVVNALANAGLRIEFLHEHDHADFRQLPGFEQNDAGQWRPPNAPRLPWTFSLLAQVGQTMRDVRSPQ